MKSGLPIVRLQFPTLNWRRTLYREIPEPIGRPMRFPTERVDVLIIGAGQSGLTMGRELLARGVSVRIVDENDRIGAAWRKRWNGLRLFSTRSYSSLPGYFMCGDPEGYPETRMNLPITSTAMRRGCRQHCASAKGSHGCEVRSLDFLPSWPVEGKRSHMR